MNNTSYSIAFIGTAGVPNRYGGFEEFLEYCGPEIARHAENVIVTCDAAMYANQQPDFNCMHRIFLPIRANGAMSVLHDLLAFFAVFGSATHIVVLGISAGPWFPFFRLLCALGGKRLLVNVDGVEWRRTKFNIAKKLLLRCFSALAQRFSHVVIYDNEGLRDYLWNFALTKAVQINYSGDHVIRLPKSERIREVGTALTICRIVPENNIEMLIEGALSSSLDRYTLVGNWSHSAYGRELKARYCGDVRLVLLDAIYEAHKLSELRESCDNYLHGHSVGGTNPSLVEMLFYDCKIFCIDMSFNRVTAGNCAYYFKDENTLALLLDTVPDTDIVKRKRRRSEYRREKIATQYIAAMGKRD